MRERLDPRSERRIWSGQTLLFDSKTGVEESARFVGGGVEGRERISYRRFVKMNNEMFGKLVRVLSNTEVGYLILMQYDMSNRNMLHMDYISERLCANTFNNFRSKLRKLGVIDRLRINGVTHWYMNPFVMSKSKEIRKEVYDHFKSSSIVLDYVQDEKR